MTTSYNGWPASPNLDTRPLVVAGESFSPGILDNDDVYEIFRALAEFLHEHVEPIVAEGWHQADDWGFSYRATTGGSSLSNHASGTAIDYNATRHPYGVHGTWSAEQIRKVDDFLENTLMGAVRWGEHYSTPDGMHFEINTDRDRVAAVADRLRKQDEMTPAQERKLDNLITRTGNLEDRVDQLGKNLKKRDRAAAERAAARHGVEKAKMNAILDELEQDDET